MVQESVKVLYAVTGGTSIVIGILLVVSFSTPNWTEVIAIRDNTSDPGECFRQDLGNPQPPTDRYTGFIEFGVIYGYKQFNYGYGARDRVSFIVFKEYSDVFNTKLVIVALTFVIPAIIFSVPAAILGFVNYKMVPIETINGRPGLYVWNILGLLSSVISVSVYVPLQLGDIASNAVSVDDATDDFCTHSTWLGYSFWLLVTAVTLYFVNVAIIVLTELIINTPECLKQKHRTDKGEGPNAVELSNGIMY